MKLWNKCNAERCKAFIRKTVTEPQTKQLQTLLEDIRKMATVSISCWDLFLYDSFILLGALGAMVTNVSNDSAA